MNEYQQMTEHDDCTGWCSRMPTMSPSIVYDHDNSTDLLMLSGNGSITRHAPPFIRTSRRRMYRRHTALPEDNTTRLLAEQKEVILNYLKMPSLLQVRRDRLGIGQNNRRAYTICRRR